MTTYAKLNDGAPVFLERVPYISNATETQIAEYAAAQGFKSVLEIERPGLYYNIWWHSSPQHVRRDWQAWALTDAKADAMERVQGELTAALAERVEVPCEGIPNGIVSDNDAAINALGEFRDAAYMTDADNVLHPVTPELTEAVKDALAERRNDLYTLANYRRALITAAANVLEVEAALTATPNL